MPETKAAKPGYALVLSHSKDRLLRDQLGVYLAPLIQMGRLRECVLDGEGEVSAESIRDAAALVLLASPDSLAQDLVISGRLASACAGHKPEQLWLMTARPCAWKLLAGIRDWSLCLSGGRAWSATQDAQDDEELTQFVYRLYEATEELPEVERSAAKRPLHADRQRADETSQGSQSGAMSSAADEAICADACAEIDATIGIIEAAGSELQDSSLLAVVELTLHYVEMLVENGAELAAARVYFHAATQLRRILNSTGAQVLATKSSLARMSRLRLKKALGGRRKFRPADAEAMARELGLVFGAIRAKSQPKSMVAG